MPNAVWPMPTIAVRSFSGVTDDMLAPLELGYPAAGPYPATVLGRNAARSPRKVREIYERRVDGGPRTVSGASGLGGIALDTVENFGHRLLVTSASRAWDSSPPHA